MGELKGTVGEVKDAAASTAADVGELKGAARTSDGAVGSTQGDCIWT